MVRLEGEMATWGANEYGPLKVGEQDERPPVSPMWPLFHHRPDVPGNTDWLAGVYIDIRPDESKEEARKRAVRIAEILSAHAWE